MFISILTGVFFRKKKNDNEQFNKRLKVLIAILTGITAQILMITKNYVPWTQYYLIPSFILLISGLCISGSIIFELFKNYFKHITLKHFYIFSSLIVFVLASLLIINTYKEAAAFRDEAYMVRNIIKNEYQNELVIPSLMTVNDCALAYMVFNDFGGSNNKKYTDLLAGQLKTEIYFLAQRAAFLLFPEM